MFLLIMLLLKNKNENSDGIFKGSIMWLLEMIHQLTSINSRDF